MKQKLYIASIVKSKLNDIRVDVREGAVVALGSFIPHLEKADNRVDYAVISN